MKISLVLSQSIPCLKIFDHIKHTNEILHEHMGATDSDGIKKTLQAVARLPVETLILDSAIAPDTGILLALHAFKIARPQTRVIFIVSGRQPGDELVSRVIDLGFYDIIEHLNDEQLISELALCLDEPYVYSRVVTWHRAFRDDSEIKLKEIKEQAIAKRRPVGTATVAIAGVAPGVGCTHTALAISVFLSKFGSVALVEDSQNPCLSTIRGLGVELPKQNGGFRLNNVDICFLPPQSDDKGSLYERLKTSLISYDYIVRDLGYLTEGNLGDVYSAECGLLVASASSWRIMDFVKVRNALKDDFSTLNVVASIGTEKEIRLYKQVTNISPTHLPFSTDPMQIPKESEQTLTTLLKHLLPEKTSKRRFGLF